MRGVLVGFAVGVVASFAWWARPVSAKAQDLDPLRVDPEHYHLEFENSWIQVIRCRIPPHDKVAMHHHAYGSMIVLLTDQNLMQTEADGTRHEAHRKAGEVFWGEPTTHMGENISDKPYEYVRVDIKATGPR